MSGPPFLWQVAECSHQSVEEVAPQQLWRGLDVDILAEDLDRFTGFANRVIEVSRDERLVQTGNDFH